MNSSRFLHSLILKSMYSSSLIHPLSDSLTGLSVGLPALDIIDPASLSRSGGNTVHSDPILRHLKGNAAGQCFKRCFTRAISNLSCENLCCICGKIDDSSTITVMSDEFSYIPEPPSPLPGQKQMLLLLRYPAGYSPPLSAPLCSVIHNRSFLTNPP